MDIRLINAILGGIDFVLILSLMIPRWHRSRAPRRLVWITLAVGCVPTVGGSLFHHSNGSPPSVWTPCVTAYLLLIAFTAWETRQDDKKRNPQ